VRIVGHRVGVLGTGVCPSQNVETVVLDAAEPAAYCVAGRPRAIVITRGALASLDDQQLAAVLAHERAHMTGHHAQLVAVLRGLAATFPSVGLFGEAAQQVSRLLEMCADDTAARQHGPAPLLAGLLTLARATPAPAGALAASGVAVLDRAKRLAADSPEPERNRARAALVGAMAMAATGPFLTFALAAFAPLLCAMWACRSLRLKAAGGIDGHGSTYRCGMLCIGSIL
jgi:Peptidase family M48